MPAPSSSLAPSPSLAPSQAGAQHVVRATLQAQIAWNAYPVGLFTIGVSTLSGPDTLAASQFSETFGGTYDDVSGKVSRAHWERGRNDLLTQLLAGNGTLELRDATGTYNPANPASPLYGLLEGRMHPVRLRQTYDGTVYPQFYGWTRKISWQPKGRKGIAQVELVDLFYWLGDNGAKPTIAPTGPTTTGAAIGKILDAAGFIDPAARSLATGDTIPDFTADGTKTALELIQGLLDAERGYFYIDAQGRAVYESRNQRLLRTSAGTVTNTMTAVEQGVDFDLVKNRVTVVRTQNNYTAVATDDASRRKLGWRDLPTISTPYLASNAAADSLAAYVLAQVVAPRPPLRALELDNREANTLTQLLARELNQRLTVSEAQIGTSGDYMIEQISRDLDGVGDQVSYQLSRAPTGTLLVIGTGIIGTDRLAL